MYCGLCCICFPKIPTRSDMFLSKVNVDVWLVSLGDGSLIGQEYPQHVCCGCKRAKVMVFVVLVLQCQFKACLISSLLHREVRLPMVIPYSFSERRDLSAMVTPSVPTYGFHTYSPCNSLKVNQSELPTRESHTRYYCLNETLLLLYTVLLDPEMLTWHLGYSVLVHSLFGCCPRMQT